MNGQMAHSVLPLTSDAVLLQMPTQDGWEVPTQPQALHSPASKGSELQSFWCLPRSQLTPPPTRFACQDSELVRQDTRYVTVLWPYCTQVAVMQKRQCDTTLNKLKQNKKFQTFRCLPRSQFTPHAAVPCLSK